MWFKVTIMMHRFDTHLICCCNIIRFVFLIFEAPPLHLDSYVLFMYGVALIFNICLLFFLG